MVVGADERNLSKIEFLSDLSESALETIARTCSWRQHSANEQIIDRESDSRDVYFITRGRVRVVIYSLSGREVTLDDMDAGSCFGELAAIDGQPRSASVMAVESSTIASMSPHVFRDVLREHPDVAFKVMMRLAWILRMSNERLLDLSTLGAIALNRYRDICRTASVSRIYDSIGVFCLTFCGLLPDH